ncbi:MAG: hypothetical protein AAF842_05830 [Planctomycetota bacterium]
MIERTDHIKELLIKQGADSQEAIHVADLFRKASSFSELIDEAGEPDRIVSFDETSIAGSVSQAESETYGVERIYCYFQKWQTVNLQISLMKDGSWSYAFSVPDQVSRKQ